MVKFEKHKLTNFLVKNKSAKITRIDSYKKASKREEIIFRKHFRNAQKDIYSTDTATYLYALKILREALKNNFDGFTEDRFTKLTSSANMRKSEITLALSNRV